MSIKKSIEKLRMALIRAEAGNLFTEDSNEIQEACIEYLKESGYKVVEPFDYTYNKVKTIDSLIELFYALHKKYHSADVNVYRAKLAVDRTTAKRFLESRMEVGGLSKEFALRECAEIIGAIFEFEEQFKFETPLNFSMLGQAKLGWVTEKAILLLNDRKRLRREQHHEELQGHLEKLYDDEDDLAIGYGDLDKKF